MGAVLEVRDLKVRVQGSEGPPVPIVKGVSFEVGKGEVVALIGESGSGKTTIALAALAYCRPGLEFCGGQVLLHGRAILAMSPSEQRNLRGRNVAYLAQSAAATFNPAFPIGEQVTESAVLHGVLTRKQADAKAAELYRALDLPDPESVGRRYPHQVSGGQLQRLMAAMALCGKPDLLVLDEPTTALDVTTQIEVLIAFKKVIRDQGTAAIYVSHDIAVVAQIADRIVVLHDGEIKEQGPVDQIIGRPSHDYTRRLMSAVRPRPATGSGEAALEPGEEIPALALTNISAGYGGTENGEPKIPVLRNIDLAVGRAKVVGVIGESGCGKSTLARVLGGLLPAASGDVMLEGNKLKPDLRQRSREELRKIQIVFQMADTALNPRQRISAILGRPLDFYHGMKGPRKRLRVAELLELVELPADFADRYPAELSGGQKQRINLARALAASPEVLLCDEVTSALDSIVAASIIELLKRLRKQTGTSFVFISHDLSTVASFADEIVVLYAGCIVERGPAPQVLSPPYHPYTRLLIASVPELRIGWLEKAIDARAPVLASARTAEITYAGCPYFNRCALGIEGTCNVEKPPLRKYPGGHVIACHLAPEELEKGSGQVVHNQPRLSAGRPAASQTTGSMAPG
ncbi:MAG: ABC transporter ATP-binding protein [Pseudaminobacter sp.]|nr:ABC transporter ATP-binding protein [Pseudaminobacter sp.]